MCKNFNISTFLCLWECLGCQKKQKHPIKFILGVWSAVYQLTLNKIWKYLLMDFDYICRFFELCYIFPEKQGTKPTKSTSLIFLPHGFKNNGVKEILVWNWYIIHNHLNGLSKNKKSAPLHLNSDFGHCIFLLSSKLLLRKKIGP
jgi:hypothetical protein